MEKLFFTVLLIFGLAFPAFCQDARFITHNDPHGFSVSVPQGWDIRVVGDGCVAIGADVENMSGPIVIVWVATLNKNANTLNVLGDFAMVMRQFYKGFDVVSIRNIGIKKTISVLKADFKDNGIDNVMVLSCWVQQDKAVISGFTAPALEFEKYKRILVKILSTFRLDESFLDPSKIAPLNGQFSKYTDVSEGAFNLSIPNGWQVQGGIIRPYMDAAINLRISDGEGQGAIYINEPSVPIFIEPQKILNMSGFEEGSDYNPSGGILEDMLILRYMPGSNYIKDYYLKNEKKSYPGMKIISTRDRIVPPAEVAYMKGLISQMDTGEVELEFRVNNVNEYASIIASTQRMVSSSGPSIWTASLISYNCPSINFEQFKDTANKIIASLKIDIDWRQREAQEIIERSSIIEQTTDEVAQMISATYERRWSILNDISKRCADAIGCVISLRNSSTGGLTGGISEDSCYYWKQACGIIGIGNDQAAGITVDQLKDYEEIVVD